jgi:hypothetical protein
MDKLFKFQKQKRKNNKSEWWRRFILYLRILRNFWKKAKKIKEKGINIGVAYLAYPFSDKRNTEIQKNNFRRK